MWPNCFGQRRGQVDEGFQCMVCGWGGGSLYPNYTQSFDGKKEGKVSGKDLPWQRTDPRMFAQLGFARPLSVCDAKTLGIATLKPHTQMYTCSNKQWFRQSTQLIHTGPTRTLGLKVLFILVTGCGSEVILLQYWVTTTTLVPPFKFSSWPNFVCLAPQVGAPVSIRRLQSYLWQSVS